MRFDSKRLYGDSACVRQKLLTLDEERALARRALAGDMPARHELTERNMRLVFKYVGPYLKSHPDEFDDLIAEGNEGLFHATSVYDPDHPSGARFATYATRWIKQRMSLYVINKLPSVRIPAHMVRLRNKVERGDELDPTELEVWRKFGHNALAGSVSTSDNHAESGNDWIPETILAKSESPAYSPDHYEWIRSRLATLSERDRSILMQAAGADGPQNNTEIGVKFGVSRERVRQIVDQSLRRICLSIPPDLFVANGTPLPPIGITAERARKEFGILKLKDAS